MNTRFTAYIDDTGNGGQGAAIFNFAGWTARVEDWERFSHAWRMELNKPPTIAYFKHNEAKGQSGQFEGLSPIDCDKKILSLANIIANSGVKYGFITGVRHDAINDVLDRFAVPPKTFRSIFHVNRPYDWCFHAVLKMVFQRQLELAETDSVDFIFDEGDSAFDECARIYRELRDEWPCPKAMKAIAGRVATGDDKLLPPLQAADLLAGQATMKLRGQEIEEPFKLLCVKKPILSMPIRRGDPFLRNTGDLATLFNIVWSTKRLERAKKQEAGQGQ